MKQDKLNASSTKPDGEATLYQQIRELIVTARQTVARGVDLVQVRTNFEIGRHIIEYDQQGEARAAYGKELLTRLAERLTQEFGKGFARSNIAYMRSFYLTYQDRVPSHLLTGQLPDSTHTVNTPFQIVQTASGQSTSMFSLSWSHYIFLLGIKNQDERNFYEIEATSQSWTVRELKRQFNSSLYERLVLSRDKNGVRQLAEEGQIVTEAHDILKEPYVLEFLGLSEQARYSESELETAIISQIEHFLLELGKGFRN
jgi:predicted nuclease of restriction endonuclease-like (RecB) superfamily